MDGGVTEQSILGVVGSLVVSIGIGSPVRVKTMSTGSPYFT
jgi:hypothetical protein